MLQNFIKIIVLLLITPAIAFAQKGAISGHVKDKATGEDVIGASVFLDGTTIGTATDISGNFQFTADPGTYKLVVSYVGYKKLVIEGVNVKADEVVNVSLQVESEDQTLEEVVVKATADKTSENILLMERKNSISIVQSIGAQELSRKGVSDAEEAVTQVTGVSKQQGVKNVYVRGLGDRYNSTTMNGMPLPSEDPAFKNISLNFFSTNVIDNIEVNKTFSSNLFADVAGANINIVSKKLFEEREFTVQTSAGVNSLVAGKDFYRADGSNFLGITDSELPITDLNVYSFKNSFKPNKLSGPLLNQSHSVSGGRSFDIGSNSLKVFLVGAMTSDFGYKAGKEGFTNTEGLPRNDYTYKNYEYNTSQFGLANFTYEYGNENSLSYNALYIHDNKEYVKEFRGFSLNGVDDPNEPNAYDMFIRRQQTNNNVVFVNQLLGSFKLSEKMNLDVKGSFNTVKGDEPDRRQNWLIGDGTGEHYVANNSSPRFNHRYFITLKEKETFGSTMLSYKLSESNKLEFGYNIRITDRDFTNLSYDFAHPAGAAVDPNDPDAYFNQQNLDNGIIDMKTSRGTTQNPQEALVPFFYTADRTIHSGFANINYQLSSALSLIVGARFEYYTQKVTWSQGGDEIREDIPGDNTVNKKKPYILPSVNLKYDLSENDQIRFSSSMTYTLPQFKEIAPFVYEEVNYNVFGNRELRPAQNFNVDIKYEHYFPGDGIIAISGFYKHIKDAINKIQVNSAALEYSYLNTGDADVAGAEIEFRRKLFNVSRSSNEAYISTGANISYLYSTQALKNDPNSKVQFIPSSKTSALEGASPLLVTGDITLTRFSAKGRKSTSALVLNYYSSRVYALGSSGQNNVRENSLPTLDWITKWQFSERFGVNFNVRNILNPEYKQTKEIHDSGVEDLILQYKRGISTSLGLTYKL